MSFCPNCGRKSKGLCAECKPKNTLLVKDINIKLCTACKKYFHKNTWKNYNDIRKIIIKLVKENTKKNELIIEPELDSIEKKPGHKQKINIKVCRQEDTFVVPAQIEYTYCNNCSKNQGNYFEGILQLRDINTDILSFVEKRIHISKKKKVRKGFDFYITDKKILHDLGQALIKNFGGKIKESPTLFSKDRLSSKPIYRLNILYSAPDYEKGDVVEVKDKLILVKAVGKTIKGINLKTQKNDNISLKNKEYKVLKPLSTTVSKVSPIIEVLDPYTYQSTPVQNLKKVKHGQRVKVVISKGLFYLL